MKRVPKTTAHSPPSMREGESIVTARDIFAIVLILVMGGDAMISRYTSM